MADIFSSHPYPGRKDILPSTHMCQSCNKTIAYKDKMAHERGKKHKLILVELDKAAVQASGADEAGEYGFTPAQYEKPALRDGTGCHNCGGAHMAKDCSQPRRDTRECHNCKKAGHISKDCPEPAQKTCRNCLKVGHISKECLEPRNPATVTCNNCGLLGHFSRDCTEPKDWSKVICNNCRLPGHTVKRCTNEPAALVGDDIPAPVVVGDWENNTATSVAVEGDWANTGRTETATDGGWANKAATATTNGTDDGADSWGNVPATVAATDGW